MAAFRVIDVYPYRRASGPGSRQPGVVPEWLLFRRAPHVAYGGTWRMVGGKTRPGEPGWRAALREVHEETGAVPARAWALPSVNAFYEWREDRLSLAPAFAAELTADPVLNHEHDLHAWLSVDEAVALLAWPEQIRLLQLADRLLRTDAVAADWYLPPDADADADAAAR